MEPKVLALSFGKHRTVTDLDVTDGRRTPSKSDGISTAMQKIN